MKRLLLFLAFASGAFAQITSSPSGVVGTGLPSQGGHASQFLTTNGTIASWAAGGATDWVTAHATTANAMGALAINTAKTLNTKSISADSTFTFSGTPAADTWFSMLLTEGGAANRTVTIPSSISVNRGGAITTFTLAASSKALLTWYYDGTNYILYGDPVLISDLTEDTAPDGNADFLEEYDISAGLHKKVKPKNLLHARITTITSSATPTVNTDNADCVTITALAAAITSMTTNLSGAPVNFDQLEYRIKDDGTARAITWGASFVAGPVAIPITTVVSKALHVWWEWDSVRAAWVCLSSGSDS